MHETVKEVDEETVTKESIAQFTRDHSTSIQSDNVEDIGEINNFLMIESEITNNNKTVGQLKDGFVCILNYVKHIMQDSHNKKGVDDDNKKDKIFDIVEKRKYEQSISECKSLKFLILTVVGRNITIFSEQ